MKMHCSEIDCGIESLLKKKKIPTKITFHGQWCTIFNLLNWVIVLVIIVEKLKPVVDEIAMNV